MCKDKISLDEAKNQQNKILNLNDELQKNSHDDKPGRPYNEGNKKSIKRVIENAVQDYSTRNDIINMFEKVNNVKKKTG